MCWDDMHCGIYIFFLRLFEFGIYLQVAEIPNWKFEVVVCLFAVEFMNPIRLRVSYVLRYLGKMG